MAKGIQRLTRAQAIAKKITRYFTGIACPHGHNAQRHTSNGTCIECTRKYKRENPTKQNPEVCRRYRERNREKLRLRSKKWKNDNPESAKQHGRKWRKSNQDTCRALIRNRRARRKNAKGHHTGRQIKAMFKRQKGLCKVCRCDISGGYHADHVIPLIRGGSNWIKNIQLLCARCNRSKGAKLMREWGKV